MTVPRMRASATRSCWAHFATRERFVWFWRMTSSVPSTRLLKMAASTNSDTGGVSKIT